MNMFTKEILREKLLDLYDYKFDEVNATISELMSLSREGQAILMEYFFTGILPIAEKDGLSLRKMREQAVNEMTDIGLIVIYDGINRYRENLKDI